MPENTEVGEIVNALIQTKVIQAFHDAPEAIDKLVQAALSQQVTEHGGRPDSWSREKMPFLEWLTGETIRRAATRAVIAVVEEREAEIHAAVRKALTADRVVDGIVAKILGSIKGNFGVTVQFADEKET